VHQVGGNQAGKGEWASHCLLRRLRQAQQLKGDQSDSNLNANRVFRGADKAGDFECLLDPAEEQFDGPSSLVQIGDDLGWSGQVIGHDPQDLAAVDDDPQLADVFVERVLAVIGLTLREMADAVGENVAAVRYGLLLSKVIGV